MRGAMTQLQVTYALLLRETKTRFGSHHLGYLWAVLQPALWIGMFALAYTVFGRASPPGLSGIAFLTCGIVPFSLFRETTHRCMSAIDANKGLLFYPQVRPLDLVLARTVLEAATHLVVMVVFMGGLALYEGPPRVESLLTTLGGLALASGLGTALGLLFCALSVYSNSVERLFPVIHRTLFWTSALFHPVDSLPQAARKVLLMNPLTHAIELVRAGWFPGYSSTHIDVRYVAIWLLALLFLGLTLERLARRRLELS
jgi:capsular polysaccharide transport system permease protein